MATLKELAARPNPLAPGHRTCAGCTAPLVVRQVLMATKDPVVVGVATGCLEVTTSIYPYTSWNVPFIHNAFENVAATVSGAEAAYQSFKRQGKMTKEVRFVAFGGDGGTYDIGLQWLSGAMERGHDMLYVCYDNGAYMNTGIQRSGATPMGAHTTTAPAGKVSEGKTQRRKNLAEIMVAHGIPYVAQATATNWRDLNQKAEKAFSIRGPKFLVVLAPCTVGWGYEPEDAVQISKLAVETCFWPLFEVEDGKYKINYVPKEKLPIQEFLKPQVRFKHLFRGDHAATLAAMQKEVDDNWARLQARAAAGV